MSCEEAILDFISMQKNEEGGGGGKGPSIWSSDNSSTVWV